MKSRIIAYFKAHAVSPIDLEEFFSDVDPNEIFGELEKFSSSEIEEMGEGTDAAYQLAYYLVAHSDLTIRTLIKLNTWRHQYSITENTFIGGAAFTDGTSPAEDMFRKMTLNDQIGCFLAIGNLEEPWEICDALELSLHLKLTGSAAEIRDRLSTHANEMNADGVSKHLLQVLVIVVTDVMKEIAE